MIFLSNLKYQKERFVFIENKMHSSITLTIPNPLIRFALKRCWLTISPCHFVIFMEFLSHDILKALELNHWKPVSISRKGPTSSHLFFADDVLLFTKATRSQAIMMEGILTNFANVSGLKVNISKSRAFFLATTIRNTI